MIAMFPCVVHLEKDRLAGVMKNERQSLQNINANDLSGYEYVVLICLFFPCGLTRSRSMARLSFHALAVHVFYVHPPPLPHCLSYCPALIHNFTRPPCSYSHPTSSPGFCHGLYNAVSQSIMSPKHIISPEICVQQTAVRRMRCHPWVACAMAISLIRQSSGRNKGSVQA